MPEVVCTRSVSHKPKCTRVYKYRITLRPWYDRARYTLKTAQVKPRLCLGRMQTMKTPVFNSIWLAWTVYSYLCALRLYGSYRASKKYVTCAQKATLFCVHTHTDMHAWVYTCVWTCVWPCGWQWRRARADWYVNISEHTLVYKHPHTFVYTN